MEKNSVLINCCVPQHIAQQTFICFILFICLYLTHILSSVRCQNNKHLPRAGQQLWNRLSIICLSWMCHHQGAGGLPAALLTTLTCCTLRQWSWGSCSLETGQPVYSDQASRICSQIQQGTWASTCWLGTQSKRAGDSGDLMCIKGKWSHKEKDKYCSFLLTVQMQPWKCNYTSS